MPSAISGPPRATGTTPPGAQTEEQASRWVRGMFGRIAPRYDVANTLLSFSLDRYWRTRTVQAVKSHLDRPGARVLDLACGTGPLLQVLEQNHTAMVFGSDFCHPMLQAVQAKGLRSPIFESDALRLPLADASIDLITIGFGFRNFANYSVALRELRRVLRPGGQLALLEFSTPPNALLRVMYNGYSRYVLPWLGGLLSGARDAYAYLPESVRKFPGAEQLAADLEQSGFSEVRFERLTFGIVALHLADAK